MGHGLNDQWYSYAVKYYIHYKPCSQGLFITLGNHSQYMPVKRMSQAYGEDDSVMLYFGCGSGITFSYHVFSDL